MDSMVYFSKGGNHNCTTCSYALLEGGTHDNPRKGYRNPTTCSYAERVKTDWTAKPDQSVLIYRYLKINLISKTRKK